ncbi:MAG: ATP-binding protein [Bacteroidia bacterium]|nr:ATP-binding protein [Bacteroidia bacterium]
MNSGKDISENDDSMSFLSREKYFADHILNNSRSMISVINRDYVYEKVNTTFCKAHKGLAEYIVGKTLGDVWGQETFRNSIKQNIDKCFSGATVKYEASFTVPQAGRRYFEVVFRPFPVESGEITHLLAETFDITDLKLSEKIAIEKEEEFKRMEQMLEDRLLQAQKLETIGALAGGIAHDFNNILATISGYSELLQEDLPKTSASYQKVTKIQTAVSKARSLINQMLTFSRQVEQEKVTVNVYEVLKETIGFIKSAAPDNVTVRSNIRSKNAFVFADPTQLFRVFLNLMTNAIQALEEREGIISVSLKNVSGKSVRDELNKMIVADEYVLVTFRDTGRGMDPSLLRRIFEPFFTTRDIGKGSGLGLSVVHGIITEMGGEILVSSEKDKGSVFYVYLPISAESAKANIISEKRKRIFLIMGNKHESRILSLALESAGYELILSSSPKNLADAVSDRNSQPDLIIFMSDAENIKAVNLLDALQKSGSEIPCIIIDDPDHDIHEENFLNSGIVSQHIIKPVSLKEIKDAIQMSIK